VTPDDPQDLLQTISLFESLIANYQLTRARLLERQREFTDHRAVEISERLAGQRPHYRIHRSGCGGIENAARPT
jgi:hypothetical protein